MKSVRAFFFGFFIAIAACCLIGLAGYYTLSDERLAAVVATGFAMAPFEYMPQARISEPFHGLRSVDHAGVGHTSPGR